MSLKEAVVGEGGRSVTGGGKAGPGPSRTEAALAVTRPPSGTMKEDTGSSKPKLPTFLRQEPFQKMPPPFKTHIDAPK